MMCESTEQRICIKFCFKIRKTATETYQLLQQTYGEGAMGCTPVFDRFRRFKEGRTSIESNPRSGRPFFDCEGIVHFTSCAAVFGQTQHRSVAAATILTRSRTM